MATQIIFARELSKVSDKENAKKCDVRRSSPVHH
jgi:hypothetical protein